MINLSARGAKHKPNPLSNLPKFTPAKGHYDGYLVTKVHHEVPVESVDQNFYLIFTENIVTTRVKNTNSLTRATKRLDWYEFTAVESKTFIGVCL